VRFGGETLLAVFYGPRILAWLQSDILNDIVGGIIVLALVASLLSVVRLLRPARPASRRAAT
jgi:hypothetical protein